MSPQSTTDLAGLLMQAPAKTGLGIGKATIEAWDPATFSNRLNYYGTSLVDVPVISGTDALSYRPGDEVTLLTWHPVDGHRRRGLGSYWIMGRVVRPGAANAQRTIAFLQTTLVESILNEIVEALLVSPAGQDLAAFVFGQRWRTASTNAGVSTASTTYVSLSGGPSLADVPVSSSGLMVVGVQARNIIAPAVIGPPSSGANCSMSYQVGGATSRSPSDDKAFQFQYVDAEEMSFAGVGAMAWNLEAGLNEGTHTVEARYRVDASGEQGTWSLRRLIAIGL